MLKLLAENERIASFSPTLHVRLRHAYERSTAKVKVGRPSTDVASDLYDFALLFAMVLTVNLIPCASSILSCCIWQVSKSYFFFFFLFLLSAGE